MGSEIITSERIGTRRCLSHPSWDDSRAMPVKSIDIFTKLFRFILQTINYINLDTLRSLRKAWPTRIFPLINSATLFWTVGKSLAEIKIILSTNQ